MEDTFGSSVAKLRTQRTALWFLVDNMNIVKFIFSVYIRCTEPIGAPNLSRFSLVDMYKV